ncbi:MAG: universal stress protein [Acidimicrobiaceae bacterium]|nr:universal stress protein [Acidimicrobiaceae bacterium]
MLLAMGFHDVDTRTPEPLIVVGVDGSEGSNAALRWAVEEAKLTGDRVEAVSVWPVATVTHGLAVPGVDDVTAESTTAEEVHAALAGTGPVDVPVNVKCLYGNPRVVLRRAAASRPADLVVIGRTHEYLGYEVLAGSVGRAVRRNASRPVVVVPPSWGCSPRTDVIAVGMDGTRRARAALRWAMAEAGRRHATVRAVLAWDSSSRAHAAGALSVVADSHRAAQAKAEEIVTDEIRLTRESLPGLSEVEVIPVAAHAAAHVALLRESAGADLLVLGDHRRLELDELLLGSTTRVCLRHAVPPVVLVPNVP